MDKKEQEELAIAIYHYLVKASGVSFEFPQRDGKKVVIRAEDIFKLIKKAVTKTYGNKK